MSAATCSTALSVRPERKTMAPWAANSLATAVPTAPLAPKMTACLFFNKDVDVDAVFIRSFPFHACFWEQFLFFYGLATRRRIVVSSETRACARPEKGEAR